MAYVHHEFGRTYYTRKGRNRSIPIVYLHGGPGGVHKADAPLFQLADKRQVYAYTQVGGGKSSPTPKKYWNIKTFVQELDILTDNWGLDRFHLIGGSWGTTLALEYYLRHPGRRVVSLVFQSPLFSSKDWKKDGRRLIKGLPKKTQKIINTCHDIGATDSKVYEDAMFQYYLKHVLRNKTKLRKSMSSKANPNGNKIYEYMWGPSEFQPTGTLKNYDRVSDLARIKVPTLVICGEHDEATPETGVRYANKIKGCAFAEIKDASHSIWVERPARIRRVINDFLDQTESL